MDSNIKNLPPGDPTLIENIVNQLKSQGIFDEFRRDCLADVDTKPAYQNLQHRVETYADDYLAATQWRPDLNKNQMRDVLRKKINDSGLLTKGVDRIIDQIVNPKIIQIILPKITEIVHKLLGIETSPTHSSNSPGVSGDTSHLCESHKGTTTDYDSSHTSDSATESKTNVASHHFANDAHACTANDFLETNTIVDKSSESIPDMTQDDTAIVTKVESDDNESRILSDASLNSSAIMKESDITSKEMDQKKEKSNKDDVKPSTVFKSSESDKTKDDISNNAGTDDGKTKTKAVKKTEIKCENKGKSTSMEKVKSGERKLKSEKVIKKEHSPAKGKSSKTEDGKGHKDSNENKEKRTLLDKKGTSTKPVEGSSKVKNEDHKTKTDVLSRPDDGAQRSRKLSEKDKCESKSHKSNPKPKCFDDKEDKSKLEKHKIEKGKDDASRVKSTFNSVKVDKSKEDKPKSTTEGGKCKSSEISKTTDVKHKTDKSKVTETKKHETGKQQKLTEKGDKLSDTKSKTTEKSKSGDSPLKHEGEKSKTPDKKSNSGSHSKGKEVEKTKSEKCNNSKLLNCGKPVTASNKDEKLKTKKETEGEHSCPKTTEKSLSHFDREKTHAKEDRNKGSKPSARSCSPQFCAEKWKQETEDSSAISKEQSCSSKAGILNMNKKNSPGKESEKLDCNKVCQMKRKFSDGGSTDSSDNSSYAKLVKCEQGGGHNTLNVEPQTALTVSNPTERMFHPILNSPESGHTTQDMDSNLEERSQPSTVDTTGEKEDGALSDVTVSSVHTSDLSDFDDRITLTESEPDRIENSPKKKQFLSLMASMQESSSLQQECIPDRGRLEAPKTKVKSEKPTVQGKQQEKVIKVEKEVEHEPRRELRRQRKLNPRYASDDFKSIFNTGKDKYHYVHNFDYSIEDTSRSIGNEPLEIHHNRGRRSTGHSNTTDDTELPGSPISDASELSEMGRSRRSGKGKWCSPSESSDGDQSTKGHRSTTPDAVEGPEHQSKSSKDGSRRSRHDRSSPTDPTPVSTRNDNTIRRDKTDTSHELSTGTKRPYRFDNQRYDNTDLYKPRPVFSMNRRRGASPPRATGSPNMNYESWGREDAEGCPQMKHDKHKETQATRSHQRKQSTETPVTRGNKRVLDKVQHSSTSKRRR